MLLPSNDLTPQVQLFLLQWIGYILIYLTLEAMRKFYWNALPNGHRLKARTFTFFMTLTYGAHQLMLIVFIYSMSILLFDPSWEKMIPIPVLVALSLFCILIAAIAANAEMFHRGSKDGEMIAATGNLFRVIFLSTVFGLLTELV